MFRSSCCRRTRLASLALLFAGALLVPRPVCAEEAGTAPAPKPAAKAGPRPLRTPPAGKPFKVPGGDAQKGWDAYLKNDFAGAEAAFREALKNNAKDLCLLEGLRAVLIARGDYKQSQQLNLQMAEASADSALCNVFIIRTVDALYYVESQAEVLAAFGRLAERAGPAVAASLKDYIATLYYRMNKPEEGRKTLQSQGYVDKWLFAAGPFGSKDHNNTIERRFAPERALKSLEFTDPGGERIQVHKDVKVLDRDLSLYTLYPGAKGLFYAFTNLESDQAQDVVLGVSMPMPYRVFLRGLPILQEPEDEQFRRSGGELVRVRLAQGANALLLKTGNAGSVSVRVMAADYAPAKGVRVKALGGDALSAQEVVPVRGCLLSEKVPGATADYFLKRYASDAKADKEAPPPSAKDALKALAESGALNVAEAVWLDIALLRENDVPAREALARTLAASFPDSVGVLDVSASILQGVGAAMGNSAAREVEEARSLREHALEKMPDSHQHLLALHHFFQERGLEEQAFEKIKACVDAHPESPLARAELGAAYQRKRFLVEAEQCYEKAAALDEAYLTRLIAFHETDGNRARARELQQKQTALGRVGLESQFETALQRGDLDRAGKVLDEQEKYFPERKDDLTDDRVRWLEEKGELKDAYKLLRKVYEARPRYHVRKRPALVQLVELALRLGKDDEARALLQGYLKEHTGDVELRQQLSELERKVLPRWWEPYDVKVKEIDTSRFTNQNYPAANHAWIVDFMVTRILPDLSAESYVHIAQKVLNLQGINELSELLVRAERGNMLFVRTLNPDGSSYEPRNVLDFNLAQSASMYKVGPGSILEHAYVMHTAADEDEPAFTMGFNFNALDSPRAVSRWVVLVPDEVKKKLDIRKIRPELIEEKNPPGPPGCTVYQWTNTQVEGIKLEPLMPPENDQEVIPLVIVEMKDRPFRAGGWLMRRDKHEIPPAAVDEARRITSPAMLKRQDDGSKFEALVLWVWKAIQAGNDSQTLADVWYSRTGRADQMADLALAMARSVGLKARSAWVNAAYVPGRTWHTKNAPHFWEPMQLSNFGSGGRMLVLEQAGEPDRWAQFSGRSPKFAWPFDLNPGQAGALALSLGDDGARLKRVRGETLGTQSFAHRVDVALDETGTGTAKGTFAVFGNSASQWRDALGDPRRQNQIREWVVRLSWPKSELKECAVRGEDHPDQRLVFDYACAVKGLAAQADGAFFLAPFLNVPRLLELRGPPERQSDLLLRDELADLDHTVTYTAPEGCAWVEAPDDVFICTEFGFYIADFNVKGRTLTCTRSYLMPAQRIAPEKYPKLLEFLQQVSASQQQRIAYARLKSESFGPYKREVYSMGYASSGEEKQPAPAK